MCTRFARTSAIGARTTGRLAVYPRGAWAARRAVGRYRHASMPHPGAPTVLVAEDDPQVRKLLERLVDGAGYGVLSAGSGAEALAALGAPGAQVDLLLTDLGLGDLHGGELAGRGLELPPGR